MGVRGMRIFRVRAREKPIQFAIELIVALILIFFFVVFIVPVCNAARPVAASVACMSNMKNLGTAMAIYESDNNESMPPYFTFDGPKSVEPFASAMEPYFLNREFLLCRTDEEINRRLVTPLPMEGIVGKMTYVHCLSLRGLIPEFDQGKRVLSMESLKVDRSQTAWLREPIRGFGDVSIPDGLTVKNTFLGPHGGFPAVAFLDSHVSARQPLDVNRDL